MKKYIFSVILLSVNLFALPNYETIYQQEYKNLPFGIEIENSGIYSIASFDVTGDTIVFSSFNKTGIYKFYSNKFIRKTNTAFAGKDFISRIKINSVSILNKLSDQRKTTRQLYRKNFLKKNSYLVDNNGKLTGIDNEKILLKVKSRNNLIIETENILLPQRITLHFPNNLAYADLIGIDTKGNMFLIIEKYLNEIPLKVSREVYILSNIGEILSILQLPNIKYLYTLKDLQIDSEGNLYHLLTDINEVKVIKWSGLTEKTQGIIYYPSGYNKEIHFNDFVPTDEVETQVPNLTDGVYEVASRTEALRIADTYVAHQYYCNSGNLAPSDVTGPDGDIVRTPAWLIIGMNARIPYKWGGFNTIAQFDAGLQNGRYAGDINTNGVSSYAVGVDCSGYVSRCWQMSYHASTAYMPEITTQYATWDDLKPGDAIHKVGHVRLFVERNINGSFKVVESAGRGWGVSYWSYTASDLGAYTPRYYNNMADNYNAQRPILTSVSQIDENTTQLNWDCDTNGIFGYRVYGSSNGVNWIMGIDENTCKTKSLQIQNIEGAKYFRISSVKNDANRSESNWSNVLGIGNFSSDKNCLIVDGFNRESGSWRGPGHTFAVRYGQALSKHSVSFITIKNSELLNALYNLNDYDFVFWILGDESTVDETFSHEEQTLVKSYLENGGNLFISGSEIGWDLDYKGDSHDKYFYNNYLKAKYITDDAANPTTAVGLDNTALEDCSMHIGQTYDEDYPDEISAVNGSTICMKYGNGKNAGVQYLGGFGSSTTKGKLIYLAFPLETTANDTSFNQVIDGVYNFFDVDVSVKNNISEVITKFELEQNYPNPFNPGTTIKYTIPSLERDLSRFNGGELKSDLQVTLKI